ncbi:MAG TPA: hypothetical protein PK970_04810, partial [Hyphomicrobiaceae bacterium]|nr:hypothetical protein [Hyphomicrobiaceae bacterium]
MTLLNASYVEEILSRGTISSADVAALRRSFYDDGAISEAEAEMLFRINDACSVSDIDWADCFVEMLTDYVVNQAQPEGYVTTEKGDWLLSRIRKSGHVDSKTELELLINIIDKARWSPESLVIAALDEVKAAVCQGEGPLSSGKALVVGRVSEGEVELLKRILYAFGGDGNIAVTRREAEILFDINDACANGENAEGWRDLFVKAIANAVMAASGYRVPNREQALAREAWLNRRGDLTLGSMLSGMASLGGFLSSYREQSPEERAIQALERQKIEIVTAERIEPAEADWLAARIFRDGVKTPNEEALIAFFKENQAHLAPEFEAHFGLAKS